MKQLWNGSARRLASYEKRVKRINQWEAAYEKLSDGELRGKTEEFKARYQETGDLDGLLEEAFAIVREASKRTTGMRHYDVQLIGGMALHDGHIGEMKTGEGKTLVSTLPAYLNALTGKGVHIITVNDYLAQRDKEEMEVIHNFLGLTVGLNARELTAGQKRDAYACDITYGTNNEFGFDYLRDNMVVYAEGKTQRDLHYCIIDEVDSILIDEARTPLIISGMGQESTLLYRNANSFVRTLQETEDYQEDVKTKTVRLTEKGVEKAEKSFGVENLFDMEHTALTHHINQALRAHVVMKNDVDYVVKDGEILIVDQFTGRLMPGRRYGEGLHQAIEAKEELEVQRESTTLATVTFQNFFRMYEKLSGMTGTAKTEEREFKTIYKMGVVVIPTNKPIQRIDQPDYIYLNEEMKYKAVVEEIKTRHRSGQPVLVGTANIETSELVSSYLKKQRIPHQVLNAKQHGKEAEIVAKAGEKGAVTIATNMAGRGTDIKLSEEVRALGGLCIIGTGRHESRRIDNQLRGRAGRQGDPGESRFFISMQDDLMKRFGTESTQAMLEKMGVDEKDPLESRMFTRAVEAAQKRVEGNNYDARKRLLDYDDVLNEQRMMIYAQRDTILTSEDVSEEIQRMIASYIERTASIYAEDEIDDLFEQLPHMLGEAHGITLEDIKETSSRTRTERIKEKALSLYREKEGQTTREVFVEFEKAILLKVVDHFWMEHIDTLSQLREGIHLRAYGQNDPLRDYKREAFELYEELVLRIEDQVVSYVLRLEVDDEQKRTGVAESQQLLTNDETVAKPIVKGDQIGRNDPCPCGSGKKYKKCCG